MFVNQLCRCVPLSIRLHMRTSFHIRCNATLFPVTHPSLRPLGAIRACERFWVFGNENGSVDSYSYHLMTSPEGNSEFCFPRISMFPQTNLRETLRFALLYNKTNVSNRPFRLMMKIQTNFEKRAEIPATTSGHLQLHALITCNSCQHFAGNSKVFLVWRHSFRNVARSQHLTVNGFIIWCQTWTGHGCAVAEKMPAL